jgi:hypothetical protein
MGESKIAIYQLKALVNNLVKPKYRRAMYMEAIHIYKNNYLASKMLDNEQKEKFNPLEKTVERLLYEINSRKSKL